jgi:hypothetical protein
MDNQMLINAAIAIIGVLGGFVLKAIKDSLSELKASDKELAEKVQAIETLVAGEYVRKADFDRNNEILFNKLDKLNDSLSDKFDQIRDKLEVRLKNCPVPIISDERANP